MKKGLFWGLFAGAATFGAGDEAVFSYKVGNFDVYVLTESQGQGQNGILLNASEADMDRYLPGGAYLTSTKVFLVRGGGKNLLIDTGFARSTIDFMKELGIDPGQVDAILLTHMHGDHIGGMQRDGKPLFPNAMVYLAEAEREYWTKTNVNSRILAVLAAYGSRVETFKSGETGTRLNEILPGISPIAVAGHTPGHTAFMIESAGKKLLVWGDLVHVQSIQFPLPDVSVIYDTDPQEAAEVRKRILSYVEKNRIAVAGTHMVYPAIGTVRRDGTGYRFVPEEI